MAHSPFIPPSLPALSFYLSKDQQQSSPYYSRTIPVLFPYNKADYEQTLSRVNLRQE